MGGGVAGAGRLSSKSGGGRVVGAEEGGGEGRIDATGVMTIIPAA